MEFLVVIRSNELDICVVIWRDFKNVVLGGGKKNKIYSIIIFT